MDLQQAADRLGVHYQTAYRWVRDGSLRAAKVASAYTVDDAEVERFLAERSKPVPPPKVAQVRSWDAQRQRLAGLLLAGDELAARQQSERLHEGGVEVLDLCEELFAPVLRDLGAAWARGELSIATEHRASAIVERLLARIAEHPRGRPRGVAVVCTPPGEEHALPASMATVCLRADRWQVHHLGTEVPTPDLLDLLASVDADLLVLSRTFGDPWAATEAEAAARACGVKVLVGQPGATLRDLVDLARAA